MAMMTCILFSKKKTFRSHKAFILINDMSYDLLQVYASSSVMTLWESGAVCVTADCKYQYTYP